MTNINVNHFDIEAIKIEEIPKNMTQIITTNQELQVLKDIALTDNDIFTIHHYLRLKKNNGLCLSNGLKHVLKFKPHLHLVLKTTPLYHFLEFKKKLLKQHLLFHQELNWQEIENIDLKSFKTNFQQQTKIIKHHWSKFLNYCHIKPSLYLQGTFYTGKTYFFKLMMKYFLHQQQSFLFLFVPELPRQFKPNWFDDHIAFKMDILKTIPYLFLDDLGAENINAYFRDDILLSVLNYREENNLSTFISSNFSPEQLMKHLSITADEQQQFKALKIVHKLKKMCEFFIFDSVKAKITS